MMTWEEIRTAAREKIQPYCKVCPVCDGRACQGKIPGPGSMGDASSWYSCMEYLKNIKLNMDTIYENHGQDTTLSIFGQTLRYPILVAPIGGMGMNYGGPMTDMEFMDAAVDGATRAELGFHRRWPGSEPFPKQHGNNAQIRETASLPSSPGPMTACYLSGRMWKRPEALPLPWILIQRVLPTWALS